jgi:pimeloyl-ACP methyl ester carboxylesterase
VQTDHKVDGLTRRDRPLAGFAPLTFAAMLLSLAGCGGNDRSAVPVQQTAAEICLSYSATSLPHGATISSAGVRAATSSLPEVCVIHGQIVSAPTSTIKWAVELPATAAWNGKTVTVGGGGFDGFIPTDTERYQNMFGRSIDPYVKISSDSGHQTPDFSWAIDDVALVNHAYEANHQVLDVGTQIATDVYGKKPTRRYNIGQSNGGRASLVAAQRYPKDYDGVVAMQPAISQQAHEANQVEMLRHFFSEASNWLSPAKTALYAKAEMAACDKLDGLEDGVINNVAACNYVPTDLLCTGADNDSCLTAGQIESIRLIYSDKNINVQLADGIRGYPRMGRGGAATSDWQLFMFGSTFQARDSFNYFVGSEAAKVVTKNTAVDYMTYDPTLYQAGWTRLSEKIDATNPDIAAFADNGGKMLVWYGAADACVSLYRTVQYFDSVKAKLGETKVRSFARLLVTPGVGHAQDGPDAGRIDLLGALDKWVEAGTAPDALVGSKLADDNQTVMFQRPVCEFPKFPRYNGTGDPKKAENFSCASAS